MGKRIDSTAVRADYALFFKPNIPLAVVEAKANAYICKGQPHYMVQITGDNRKIGGHAPSVYLRKLQEEKTVQLSDEDMDALVASHGISATTLRNADFEARYQERKLALFGLIGKAMGSS